MLLMGKLDPSVQQRVVQEMYERKVGAGEILIKEGDTGLAASELYVVKEGEFEVLERRQGVNFRVNMKNRGDCFGEVSLMYSSPRGATVAATQDSTVWVLERDTFRSDTIPSFAPNASHRLTCTLTCTSVAISLLNTSSLVCKMSETVNLSPVAFMLSRFFCRC